jgi:predicted phosphodiesterase
LRYAVICDVHSNLEALEAVLDEIKRHDVDQIVHLGDVVGYNANPNECVQRFIDEDVVSIMGNHDAAAIGLGELQWFNSSAKQALRWTKTRLKPEYAEYLSALPETMVLDGTIMLSHGSPETRDNYILDWMDAVRQFAFMSNNSINVCFFGHSHLPSLFVRHGHDHDIQNYEKHTLDKKNSYLINFGALGQPRDGDPRTCFGIFDTDEFTVEFFRVKYDVIEAARKVEKAGLDNYLVQRLLAGV